MFMSDVLKDYAQCWFDNSDAANHVEAALRQGKISALEARRLWNYIDSGYFIADGLIPNDRLEQLRTELEDFWFSESPTANLKIDGLFLDPNEPRFSLTHEEILRRPVEERIRLRDSGCWRIHGLHKVSSSCEALCRSPALWEAARSLLQVDDIHICQTNTFVYPSQQGAHEDYPYLKCDPSYHMASVWVALEDISAHQGPFYVCPGSHRDPKYSGFLDHPQNWYWSVPEETRGDWLMRSEWRSYKYPRLEFRAQAGQCLFYHANLTHGGMPLLNQGATRKSIVIFYTAAENRGTEPLAIARQQALNRPELHMNK